MLRLLNLFRVSLVAVLLGLVVGNAYAGRSCDSRPITTHTLQQGLGLAERTVKALDANGAKAAVIGRVGQDLSRYGLRYSHIGIAYKDGPHWRVVHKLNQCGTALADVFVQGLGQFFLDDMHVYEAGFVPLSPQVQEHMIALMRDRHRLVQLHTPRYNMLAYPWAIEYQQSNQWVIETLALAAEPSVRSRKQAQAWLQFKGYEPHVLRIDTFTRLGARMTRANVSFDDHPSAKRFSGRIETVSAESVFSWLQISGMGMPLQTVR